MRGPKDTAELSAKPRSLPATDRRRGAGTAVPRAPPLGAARPKAGNFFIVSKPRGPWAPAQEVGLRQARNGVLSESRFLCLDRIPVHRLTPPPRGVGGKKCNVASNRWRAASRGGGGSQSRNPPPPP